MQKKPIVLLILDGWGLAPKSKFNAVEQAKKPNFDKLWKKYPHTSLSASGDGVGLPARQPGNSEAGHMNIGAGRLVLQDTMIINRSIDDRTFFGNTAFLHAFDHIKANKSRLHLMGLVSVNGSPHSDLRHLFALIELANAQKQQKIFLHLFTDGRDSPQHSISSIIKKIRSHVQKINVTGDIDVQIVTLMGRFYAMDRGKNWNRTKAAYDCLVESRCRRFPSVEAAIEHSYNAGNTDEYFEPSIVEDDDNKEQTRVKKNDAIIFFNLRSDRARQIAKVFAQNDFTKKNNKSFTRSKVVKNVLFCALTDFGPDLSSNLVTAFPGDDLIGTMPFIMNRYKQLYIAETEKFAHVTYFINGGHADPVFAEQRVKIDSPKIRSYAQKPEMSVYKITDYIVKSIQKGTANFIVANFANPDMVGHTGDFEATKAAISHVDNCLGMVVAAVHEQEGTLFVTADHGNAEKMMDANGEINVQHTTNPVPFIVANHDKSIRLRKGILGDIAPTIYDYFDIIKPDYVTGKSLITNHK
ncbi:TPA: 2,3-bisphosphoglycerate-independent phosphoglycerate mutase [Candidatus Falkowbacteria bacterium]|nr:2,3-bisphosphoglycerate-independent phosphoglycerate mutase [Candidatus Falkowbacteria bacterium]